MERAAALIPSRVAHQQVADGGGRTMATRRESDRERSVCVWLGGSRRVREELVLVQRCLIVEFLCKSPNFNECL